MAPRPFVPLADGAQAEVRFNFGLGILETRLWFIRRSGSVTLTTLGDLAEGLKSWHAAQVMPLLSHDIELRNVRTQDWTTSGGVIYITSQTGPNGGDPSHSHSANVAILVRFRSVQPPRNFFNWNFIPGAPKVAVDLNTVDSTFLDGISDAYINLIDMAAVFGPFPAWRWVITSRRVDNDWRTTQSFARTDFIRFPSPFVSPRRHRIKPVGL